MRNLIRRTLITTIAAAALVAPAAADAYSGNFDSPSGNIVCAYSTGYSGYLVCDVRSADFEYSMTRRGYPRAHHAGGFAADFTLVYGNRIHMGSFTCDSTTVGMECTNRAGHGFFVSAQEHYRF